jgi:GNAT superfamily N-acetyltransferase
MKIRAALEGDAESIQNLLSQLGYETTRDIVVQRLSEMMKDAAEELLIAVDENDHVIAFVSVHYVPQIAMRGDFARISYFSVDAKHRSKGIGKLLLQKCEEAARNRGCDRIELHCHSRRTGAHRFYFREGYVDSPKYLMKQL